MEDFVSQIVFPLALKRRWTSFCEVGASLGQSTDRLLNLPGACITVIDPCLDLDLSLKYARESRVKVCKGLSLEVLPKLEASFDCILLDGDHNWYTVYEELKTIQEKRLLKPGGVIFLDDVEWPYGRRDMYYQPDLVPGAFRQPYAKRGIVRGEMALSLGPGLNEQFCNALHEGGPRNGVLTAVEDFLSEYSGRYRFLHVQRDSGLSAIMLKGGFLEDLWFLRQAWESTAYNLFTWPKRWTRSRFPFAYKFAKSLLGRT